MHSHDVISYEFVRTLGNCPAHLNAPLGIFLLIRICLGQLSCSLACALCNCPALLHSPLAIVLFIRSRPKGLAKDKVESEIIVALSVRPR